MTSTAQIIGIALMVGALWSARIDLKHRTWWIGLAIVAAVIVF